MKKLRIESSPSSVLQMFKVFTKFVESMKCVGVIQISCNQIHHRHVVVLETSQVRLIPIYDFVCILRAPCLDFWCHQILLCLENGAFNLQSRVHTLAVALLLWSLDLVCLETILPTFQNVWQMYYCGVFPSLRPTGFSNPTIDCVSIFHYQNCLSIQNGKDYLEWQWFYFLQF
jgi:hypothetical protein